MPASCGALLSSFMQSAPAAGFQIGRDMRPAMFNSLGVLALMLGAEPLVFVKAAATRAGGKRIIDILTSLARVIPIHCALLGCWRQAVFEVDPDELPSKAIALEDQLGRPRILAVHQPELGQPVPVDLGIGKRLLE